MGIKSDCGLISVLIFLISFGEINSGTIGQGERTAKISKHPVIIIISYDGFRYDYLEKTETPNLTRMKKSGVSVPYMMNQFLTNTFPNHHSIATGRYIESHGVVGNTLYDPLYGYLSGYNDDPGFWNYSSTVLPLWTVNELAGDGRASGVMMWCGSNEPWGPEDTRATYRTKFNKTYPFKNRIDDVVSWITNEERPANLVFMYFEEPDSVGHDVGPDGERMIETIKEMDDLTGYLLDKLEDLGIQDKVNLIFLSDHGMQELSEEKEIDIVTLADTTLYEDHGSNPVLQILPKNESTTMDLYNEFKRAAGAYNNSFEVFLKEDLKELKPHWHYEDTRRIMPILLVAKLGYTFVDSSLTNPWKARGQHGFDSAYPEMRPYFIAKGPLFKVNATEDPFENIDIYPLICHVLDIETPPNNGSLANTLPLLRVARQISTPTGVSLGGAKGYEIVGIIAGVVAVVAIVGLLVFARRRQRLRSVNVTWNG